MSSMIDRTPTGRVPALCGTTGSIPAVATAPRMRLPRLPRLPRTVAFVGASLALAGMFLAAGAPTPLLSQLQERWGFPAGLLTIAFSVYAIGLVAAILVFGSLSDRIGRRPVLIGALAVETIAMVMFVGAPDIGWVIAARVVQGLATGAATSAFSAAIVELAPDHLKRLGTIIGSTAPAGGLGIGALFAGLAVQLSPEATEVVFVILTAVMLAGLLVTLFSIETVTARGDVRSALIPRVRVPGVARREYVGTIPVLIGAWMFSGLFMGLVPTIIRGVFGFESGLLNGATVFLAPGAAAVVGFVFGRLTPRRTLITGGILVLAGTALLAAAVLLPFLPLLWLGGIVGGLGFGAQFSGSTRTLVPLAASHERAELLAGVFLVAYLAFGVPAILAGQAVAIVGIVPTVLGYAAVVVIAAVVGLAVQARLARS